MGHHPILPPYPEETVADIADVVAATHMSADLASSNKKELVQEVFETTSLLSDSSSASAVKPSMTAPRTPRDARQQDEFSKSTFSTIFHALTTQ
jgi:hypothetical protein